MKELFKSLFSNLFNYFSKRKEVLDTKAADIEIVKQEAKDVRQTSKQQRRLDKKHSRKKKSYLVSKLKPGMTVRVHIDGKWEKLTYKSHDEQGVTTTNGEIYPYGKVANYHMKELYYAKT